MITFNLLLLILIINVSVRVLLALFAGSVEFQLVIGDPESVFYGDILLE